MLAGLLIAALGVSVEVSTETESPSCDWATVVPAALGRLPTLTVTSSASIVVRLAEAGGDVQVTLTEAGEVKAERRLPAVPPCEVRADGIALVVEQQLMSLGYVSPAAPTPAVAPSPTLEPPAAPFAIGPIELGLEGLLDLSARLDDGVAFEAGLKLGPSFAALLRLSSILPESTAVTRNGATVGALTVWSAMATAGGEGCWAAGPGLACGLAGAGVEWSRGSASGETLFRTGTENTLRFVGAAGARYRLPIGDRFGIRAGALALWRPNGPTFSVEDGGQVETPVLTLRLGMGVDVKFSP